MTAFPFSQYWWLYVAFTGLILALLWVDLRLHRRAGMQTVRAAAWWTCVWVMLALVFCGALYWYASMAWSPATGRQMGMEFLAGYIVEESLSIDNMFVFALMFRYFRVPGEYQHEVLFYGVLGAIVFRAIFIAVGTALIHLEWVLILFGVFLVFSGIRLGLERGHRIDPGESRIIHALRRVMPVTQDLHGHRFFVRISGRLHATPLLVVLMFLETTDIVFATDSVPAVLGVTREPFVVYTSNLFAVLGLRSLYFLLAGGLERFHLLRYGLAFILVFVGLKMVALDRLWGGRFPILASLAIIAAAIAIPVALSGVVRRPAAAQPGR